MLHGHWSESGERSSIFVHGAGGVSNDEDFGMIWDGEIGIDDDAPLLVEGNVESFENGRGLVASCPEDVFCGNEEVLDGDTIFSDVGDPFAGHDLHAKLFEVLFGFFGKPFGIDGEDVGRAFEEKDFGFGGVDAAEIF